ncbi:hypothetical protein [Azospirillum brasilense]|uniref:hypothetical protein n=1 Tax=Azospirillum brasilense TaxID=192 RepID=UPI001EDA658C|nr:hypothetical protein [Azospirillum brasilense]
MTRPLRAKILRPDLDPAARKGASGENRCRCCGRPGGAVVRCLPDGRWYDAADQTWRDGRGRRAVWPDVVEYAETRDVQVVVRPVRPSGNPEARPKNLCRRCHMQEEALRNAIRSRIRARMRHALGDLFLGDYSSPGILERAMALYRRKS